MSCEFADVPAGFRKGIGTRVQIANICWIIEKAREFQKNFCFLSMPKPLTVWITTNCGKFLKIWEYQTTWPASWEICMQVRKQQLELDMEQQTGSKSGKEYVKVFFILSPCLFNSHAEYTMRNAGLDEAQAGIRIAVRNISSLGNADDTTLMAESKEEIKSLLMKVKEESRELGLKLNIWDHGIWSHHSMA